MAKPKTRKYELHGETVWPMPDKLRPVFLTRLEEFRERHTRDPSGWEAYPWDPYRVVMFLWEMGAHPDVIVHPTKRHLHVETTENGMVYVRWFRPKTKKLISMPAPPSIRPWVESFVEDLKKNEGAGHLYVTQHYTVRGEKEPRERIQDVCPGKVTRLVKKVGRELGPEFANYTPRSLRHTRGRRILEATHDITAVQKYLGTSLEVAGRYSRLGEDENDKRIADGEA